MRWAGPWPRMTGARCGKPPLRLRASTRPGAQRGSAPPPCPRSALAALPRLRLLSLTLTEALPAGHHRQLAALKGLEELHLYLLPSQPAAFEFQPGALAPLARLRALLLVAPPGSMCDRLTIGPGLPRLAALQELQARHSRSLRILLDQPFRDGVAAAPVQLHHAPPCPPHPRPLPRHPRQVESRVEALPADLWACSHLTRLELDLRHSAGLPAPAAPPNGAACLPALRDLRLARCRLQGGALPPAIAQLTGLSRLEASGCGLASSCAHAGLPNGFTRLAQLVRGAGQGWHYHSAPSAAAAVCALLPCPASACPRPLTPRAHLSCNRAGAPIAGGQRAVHAAARAMLAAGAAPPGPHLQPAGEPCSSFHCFLLYPHPSPSSFSLPPNPLPSPVLATVAGVAATGPLPPLH